MFIALKVTYFRILFPFSMVGSHSNSNNPGIQHSGVISVRYLKFLDKYVWTNSVNSDQTAPRAAVRSLSTLFLFRQNNLAIPMNIHNILFLWRNKGNHPLIIIRYLPYLFHWFSLSARTQGNFQIKSPNSGLPYVKCLSGTGHTKMCPMPNVNNKGGDQPVHLRSLISRFVVRCW